MKFIVLMLFSMLILNSAVFAQNELGEIKQTFPVNKSGKSIAWIYFKDKGPAHLLKESMPEALLSERALKRRAKLQTQKPLTDFSDQPLYKPYVQEIRPFVDKIRSRSRWLNAISIEADANMLEMISSLEYVESVRPVRKSAPQIAVPETRIPASETQSLTKNTALDYGASLRQVLLIKADVLHNINLTGQGVLICMLDDGYNLLNSHMAFDHLDLVATRDFINNDDTVDDNTYSGEGTHGTKTLSTIAGYAPGHLIGTAYNASYILAKTEVDSSESQVEEDYWVAGIEWADSMGADIVNSSLGYGYYATEPASNSWYTWQELDGETTVTTIAADLAFEKGILVFCSAGNEWDDPDHHTLLAPSDGDNVLAIGATDSKGERAYFSSVGPSADGRTKPDLAAMGLGVTTASTSQDSVFWSGRNGTSYSCPIAAGAAALLLEAFPEITPGQLQNALRLTASQSDAPDKYLGWGVMDVEAAYDYIDTSGLENIPGENLPAAIDLSENYPNPFNPETKFDYRLAEAGKVTVKIYDMRGRMIKKLGPYFKSAGILHTQKLNLSGFASGVYLYRAEAKGIRSGNTFYKTKKMVFLQ